MGGFDVLPKDEWELQDGRTIYLQELRQHRVYEGLLEGLPTARLNTRFLKGFIEENRLRRGGDGEIWEPFLIQPVETPIDHHRDKPYPLGTPAALPSVACAGRFASSEPVRGAPDKDGSSIVILWFQEEFAFPIAPEIVEQIESIDWERLAQNDEY